MSERPRKANQNINDPQNAALLRDFFAALGAQDAQRSAQDAAPTPTPPQDAKTPDESR